MRPTVGRLRGLTHDARNWQPRLAVPSRTNGTVTAIADPGSTSIPSLAFWKFKTQGDRLVEAGEEFSGYSYGSAVGRNLLFGRVLFGVRRLRVFGFVRMVVFFMRASRF